MNTLGKETFLKTISYIWLLKNYEIYKIYTEWDILHPNNKLVTVRWCHFL